MEQQNGHAPDHSGDLKGRDPDATDFANYFCTYAFLFHQVRQANTCKAVTCDSAVFLISHIWGWPMSPFHYVMTASMAPAVLQKEMLEDHKRTGAYYTAIMQNQAQFKDKVVLDVGAGSGILAIFAAQAGARKVYAVEATAVAQHARKLVQHNRVSSITASQPSMENFPRCHLASKPNLAVIITHTLLVLEMKDYQALRLQTISIFATRHEKTS